MKIGVYTNQYGNFDLAEFAASVRAMGVGALEFGVGGMYATGSHCVAADLLKNTADRAKIRGILEANELQLSAFGVHGNPVHPDAGIARREVDAFKQACELAPLLGVDRLNLMSGLPAAGPGDRYPNWICNPWPDELQDGLQYQWDEVLIPYWSWATRYAADHGVKFLNIEAHPGMAVYNVETLLRLRSAVGEGINCNLDPSHLVWQGDVDIYDVIMRLGPLITHCHAKEVFVNRPHVRVNGILTSNGFDDYLNRPWTFRSPGYGSTPDLWKTIMFAFSVIGYDHVMSIEYEDWHMSAQDSLQRSVATLKSVVNTERGRLFGSPYGR